MARRDYTYEVAGSDPLSIRKTWHSEPIVLQEIESQDERDELMKDAYALYKVDTVFKNHFLFSVEYLLSFEHSFSSKYMHKALLENESFREEAMRLDWRRAKALVPLLRGECEHLNELETERAVALAYRYGTRGCWTVLRPEIIEGLFESIRHHRLFDDPLPPWADEMTYVYLRAKAKSDFGDEADELTVRELCNLYALSGKESYSLVWWYNDNLD